MITNHRGQTNHDVAPFRCNLDEFRPGGAVAIRLEKLQTVAKELGVQWGKWTKEEYVALCQLAGVEPMP